MEILDEKNKIYVSYQRKFKKFTIWGYITNYTLTAEKQHMPLI